jgi:hypothetical protein
MENAHELVRLAIVAGAAVLLYLNHKRIREAIENFNNSFRGGGPRTPMHPSPGNDSAFLRRRRSKNPDQLPGS